uniref:Uncharacterized protein n=1 Tax=candidate division WOR-3 bacterium TaxID=2052148 RepID=A0A7C6EC45_UNCW3
MRRKPRGPFEQYKYWIGMGVVILVFVFVLLTVGKPSSPKSKPNVKKTTFEKTERAGRTRKRQKRTAAERLAEKAKKRLEREQRREERRALAGKGTTTRRTTRQTRETKGSVRIKTETGYILKGIFVDERGERYALIGDRRARSGDVVAGRKIQEVKPDRVSIEYGGSIYEVKIGSPLF